MADDEVPDVLGVAFDEGELHFAAQDGDMTRVRELLAAGRSPNAFDEIAKTPLHYAAESGHIDVMRVLLEAGADVNANEEARIGNTTSSRRRRRVLACCRQMPCRCRRRSTDSWLDATHRP
jgi:hypothetical protein